MGWPLSQDYNEAVQNPRTAFADPDLRAAEVVPGPLGIPMPRSGNFADVYQVRAADGRSWAVKCFTRPVVELAGRYREIDAHLRAARLPFSVGFTFLGEGIRVRGQWYPALKMEWVEGYTLNEFVRNQVDRPDQLRALLGMWVRLCRRLRDARIAHADLQHGNVLLVPGATANTLRLRLIDYDGMWVPRLADRPSGEAGHPAYQHPARLRERLYSPDVDRFPHLVIGCALRALAIAGRPLWDQFDNGDNLLFREADLANPAASPLYRALWDLDDPTLTNLVSLLVLATRRPLGDTPWLDVVLDADRPARIGDAILVRAADILGVHRRQARQAVPVAQLYTVPDEANAFADLGSSTLTRRTRQHHSSAAWIAAGGFALIAASVITLAVWRQRPVEPEKSAPPDPPVNTALPAPGPDPRWVPLTTGPLVPPLVSLASGIDPESNKARLVRSYPPRGTAALGARFLPDGARAVTAYPYGVQVVDLASGRSRGLLTDLGGLVQLAVSPDGTFFAVALEDHEVHCFEVRGGHERWKVIANGAINSLAISPDARRVAAAGPGGLVEWDAVDGAELRRNPTWRASSFVYSPTASVAIAAGDAGVMTWNLEDASVHVLADATAVIECVAVSPDGNQLFAAGEGPVVKVWSLPGRESLADRPRGVRYAVSALTALPDGTLLVGSQAGELAALQPDGTVRTLLPGGADVGRVVSIAATTDGRHALVATQRGEAMLVRVSDPPKLPEVPPSGALEFVRSGSLLRKAHVLAADPTGTRILAASPARAVVYDATSLRELAEFTVGKNRLELAAVGWNDVLIISEAGKGSRVYSWDPSADVRSGLFTLPAGAGEVTRLRPAARRSWVLVTTANFGDLLFDSSTGKVVESFPLASGREPVASAGSPDGDLFAVRQADLPVRLWHAATGTLDRPCEASHGVHALAFTPDGTRLVGLWRYGRIRVWDATTGKLVREVPHVLSGQFDVSTRWGTIWPSSVPVRTVGWSIWGPAGWSIRALPAHWRASRRRSPGWAGSWRRTAGTRSPSGMRAPSGPGNCFPRCHRRAPGRMRPSLATRRRNPSGSRSRAAAAWFYSQPRTAGWSGTPWTT